MECCEEQCKRRIFLGRDRRLLAGILMTPRACTGSNLKASSSICVALVRCANLKLEVLQVQVDITGTQTVTVTPSPSRTKLYCQCRRSAALPVPVTVTVTVTVPLAVVLVA